MPAFLNKGINGAGFTPDLFDSLTLFNRCGDISQPKRQNLKATYSNKGENPAVRDDPDSEISLTMRLTWAFTIMPCFWGMEQPFRSTPREEAVCLGFTWVFLCSSQGDPTRHLGYP